MPGSFYFTLSRTLLLTLTAALLAWWYAAPGTVRLDAPPLSQFSCSVADGRVNNVFRVYQPTDYLAETLGQRLCQLLRGTDYSQVVVSWQPRAQLGTDNLLQQSYDLWWDRQHVLEGQLPAVQTIYAPLLHLPRYQVAWFSHQPHPALNADFFNGKRIGVLTDSRSQSGHQQPLEQLASHHLPTSHDQLHFYTNRQTMVDDFLAGRLDLIPGMRVFPALSRWPADQVLPIAADLPIGDWFVARHIPPALHCSLIDALRLYEPMIRQLSASSPWPVAGCTGETSGQTGAHSSQNTHRSAS